MIVSPELLKEATGLSLEFPPCEGLGVADSSHAKSILTFLSNKQFARDVNANSSIAVVLTREGDELELRPDIQRIIVEDPAWVFFSTVNYLAITKTHPATEIHASAKIHDTAAIASNGVVVGAGAIVEPHVTVMPGVVIGSGCVIRAGAVLGADGFEQKRTSKGILSVAHDGILVIGDGCEIGGNNFIAKGFSYRDTIVGASSKFDALVHYAHGVQCGERCLIAANAMVAGSVTIGCDVWIGPSASISNRLSIGDNASISIGSVVTKDVGSNQRVTGNFAIPHDRFMANLKASIV